MIDDLLNDDRPSGVQSLEAHPLAGAMHERRCGQPARTGAASSRLDQLVDRAPLPAAVLEVPPAQRRDEDVGLTPQHSLRPAGRAAGVEHVEVVGRPVDTGSLG